MSENRELFSPTYPSLESSVQSTELDDIVVELFEAYVQESGFLHDDRQLERMVLEGVTQQEEIGRREEEEEGEEEEDDPNQQEMSTSRIVSHSLSLGQFVEKMREIGDGKTYGAVTTTIPDDSVGFLRYDDLEDIMYVTTPNREMYQVNVIYMEKVRFRNGKGELEVIYNKDSMVSQLKVLSFNDRRFEEVLKSLEGKVVHARLVNGESIFGVFRKVKGEGQQNPERTVRVQRRGERGSRSKREGEDGVNYDEARSECFYEIQESLKETQRFTASTLSSVEFYSRGTQVCRYQRHPERDAHEKHK